MLNRCANGVRVHAVGVKVKRVNLPSRRAGHRLGRYRSPIRVLDEQRLVVG